ncbi:hypothetical protein [Streptomyces sp. NPDC058066]|uniref:hypothetical protein n=1 Tax=Streptomyces sp. NPDC058066 TaxID=3346323 RepID=UPI0036F0E1C9
MSPQLPRQIAPGRRYDLPKPAVFGPLPLTDVDDHACVSVTAKNTKTPEHSDSNSGVLIP